MPLSLCSKKYITQVSKTYGILSQLHSWLIGRPLLSGTGNGLRQIHLSEASHRMDDRRKVKASLPVRDEGTQGEHSLNLDAFSITQEGIFPTERTPSTLFDGIPFSSIPICNVRVSKNNTIITITDAKTGQVRIIRSCGIEGFKNTRKGTNIAAQATAITFAGNALNKGFKTIRVKLRGIGPGRMSALKGLQMAGLNIISVTDNTPVSWNPPRPRKQRKL